MKHRIKFLLKNIFSFLFFLTFIVSVQAQPSSKEKALKWADDFFATANYTKANELYLKLLEKHPDDAYINYKIGLCYYNSALEKEKAFPYLQKSVAIVDTFQEAHYFLGKIYHQFHRFDEALVEYYKFKQLVDSSRIEDIQIIEEIIKSVDTEIKRCNYGKILVQNPIKVIIENLGDEINTSNQEYTPVVSPDESILAFTRRSLETTGGKMDEDGDYFEDIYISEIEEGSLFFKSSDLDSIKKSGFYNILSNFRFSTPQNIGTNINTNTHEAAIQFSYDGKTLYFYRDFNVWESKLIDEDNLIWDTPKKLKGTVNTNAFEPSVSLSKDHHVIYFSSDRAGGYGGLDLYKAEKLSNGNWGRAVNLGPTINTPFDEDSPYLDPDGKTLYFSSKGHTSMGGYDVFKTVWDKTTGWDNPQNMGYPLNSAGNDIFFMMTPRYNRAYYSSDKLGGYGKMDLYRLTFAKERDPLAEVQGLVLEGDSLIPANSYITVYDKYNKEVASYHSDSVSGEYLLLLAHGNDYTIKAETEGFAPYMKSFHIPPQVYYYQLYQEIHHIHIKDKEGNLIGQKVSFHNAFFDIDKAIQQADSIQSVSDAADIVQRQPMAKLPAQEIDKVQQYSTFVKEIQTNENNVDYSETSDIKFYISQDSLIELMKRDTTIYSQIKGMLTSYVPTKSIAEKGVMSGRVTSVGSTLIIERDSLAKIKGQEISTIGSNQPEREIKGVSDVATVGTLPEKTDTLETKYTPMEKNTVFIEDDTKKLMFAENAQVAFFEPKEEATKLTQLEAYVPVRDIKREEELSLIAERQVGTIIMKEDVDMDSLITATTPPAEETKVDMKEIAKGDAKVKENTEEKTTVKEVPKVKTKEEAKKEPIAENKVKTKDMSLPSITIQFGFDKTYFPDSAKKKLDILYDFMQQKSNLNFQVIGHTDAMGPDAYNLPLSLQRAKAVVRYLTKKGISKERLTPIGLGETQPIAPNTNDDDTDNKAGRQQNRRVEFKIIE